MAKKSRRLRALDVELNVKPVVVAYRNTSSGRVQYLQSIMSVELPSFL
jgi:hypothetical protein